MSMPALTSVQVVRKLETSAEQTFAAWLDPGTLGTWFLGAPSGESVAVTVEPHVGGTFTVTGGADVKHVGKYLVIDPPHHLAFSLTAARRPSEHNRVSINLQEEAGCCQITLTEAGVHVEDAAQIKSEWDGALRGLASVLSEAAQVVPS